MAPEDAPTDSSHPFRSHVSRVVDRFDELVPFVLVPVLATLLQAENVRAALDPASGQYSFDLKFAFPSPLLDLWRLADPPEPRTAGGTEYPTSAGSTFTVDTPVEAILPPEVVAVSLITVVVLVLALYALVNGLLTAAYVGGLDRRLRGEPIAVGDLVVRYAPRFVLYEVVLIVAVLALVPFVLVAPPLLLLALPVALVLMYLFYAAPFLFVVADAPFVEAFRRSYRLAVDGGRYFRFALWHLGVVAIVSLVLSVLLNAGPPGFLLALAVAAPLSLVLTAASVSFLQELVVVDADAAR